MTVSPAMQEYLAEAYRLAYYQNDNPYISTSDLAEGVEAAARAFAVAASLPPQAARTAASARIPNVSRLRCMVLSLCPRTKFTRSGSGSDSAGFVR